MENYFWILVQWRTSHSGFFLALAFFVALVTDLLPPPLVDKDFAEWAPKRTRLVDMIIKTAGEADSLKAMACWCALFRTPANFSRRMGGAEHAHHVHAYKTHSALKSKVSYVCWMEISHAFIRHTAGYALVR